MRRKDREIKEHEQIRVIIEETKILHLGLFDGAYPYIIPLHYGYEYDGGDLVFYMHCAKEGHKLDLIGQNPAACVQLDSETKLISGGENPCRYGSSFASVIARGKVEIVTASDEKITALELLMKHQTGRTFTFTEDMVNNIQVLRFRADSCTAKARRQ